MATPVDFSTELNGLDQASETVEGMFAWLGDQVGPIVTVRSIVDSDRRPVSDEERIKALAFFNGEQWDADVAEERTKRGRPVLVINRLPEILRLGDCQRSGLQWAPSWGDS